MNKTVIFFIVALLWMATAWVSFWCGFYKSLLIGNHEQYLGYKIRLIEDRGLLSKLDHGNASSVRDELRSRVAINESLTRTHKADSSGLMDLIGNAVYPREAITLIHVYKQNVARERRRESELRGGK